MRIIFSQPAADDLNDIVAYLVLRNKVAARKFFLAIKKSIRQLGRFPHLGHKGRISGTYELSIARLPYIAVYEVNGKAITVLAVFHTARDLVKAWHTRSTLH